MVCFKGLSAQLVYGNSCGNVRVLVHYPWRQERKLRMELPIVRDRNTVWDGRPVALSAWECDGTLCLDTSYVLASICTCELDVVCTAVCDSKRFHHFFDLSLFSVVLGRLQARCVLPYFEVASRGLADAP